MYGLFKTIREHMNKNLTQQQSKPLTFKDLVQPRGSKPLTYVQQAEWQLKIIDENKTESVIDGPYKSAYTSKKHYIVPTIIRGDKVYSVTQEGNQPHEGTIHPNHHSAKQWMKDNGFVKEGLNEAFKDNKKDKGNKNLPNKDNKKSIVDKKTTKDNAKKPEAKIDADKSQPEDINKPSKPTKPRGDAEGVVAPVKVTSGKSDSDDPNTIKIGGVTPVDLKPVIHQARNDYDDGRKQGTTNALKDTVKEEHLDELSDRSKHNYVSAATKTLPVLRKKEKIAGSEAGKHYIRSFHLKYTPNSDKKYASEFSKYRERSQERRNLANKQEKRKEMIGKVTEDNLKELAINKALQLTEKWHKVGSSTYQHFVTKADDLEKNAKHGKVHCPGCRQPLEAFYRGAELKRDLGYGMVEVHKHCPHCKSHMVVLDKDHNVNEEHLPITPEIKKRMEKRLQNAFKSGGDEDVKRVVKHAAKYGVDWSHHLSEEQIDELSHETMKSYLRQIDPDKEQRRIDQYSKYGDTVNTRAHQRMLKNRLDAQRRANKKLNMKEEVLLINNHEFFVEVADTNETRTQGLMYRENLDQNSGMLFDFGREARLNMWMRDTYIPLDMVFVSEDGIIEHIETNLQTESDEYTSSQKLVRFVLELNAGICDALDIMVGDEVQLVEKQRTAKELQKKEKYHLKMSNNTSYHKTDRHNQAANIASNLRMDLALRKIAKTRNRSVDRPDNVIGPASRDTVV